MKLLLVVSCLALAAHGAPVKSSTWCGTNDGMIVSKTACQAAATAHGYGTVQDAGSEWHAGCIIHHGGVYYSPYFPHTGSHTNAVNDGYFCDTSPVHEGVYKRSGTWCGPNDGMIASLSDCKKAGIEFGFQEAASAGAEWHSGCIIHHGKLYYSPFTTEGTHDQEVSDGYLCYKIPETTTTTTTTTPAPVHCMHTVIGWTSCTKTCDGGEQTAVHKITQVAQHGGDACPNEQKRACNTHLCPCPNGTWRNPSTRACDVWTACDYSMEYEARQGSATQNRICEPLTTCGENEYVGMPPTRTSDRMCDDLPRCPAGKYRDAVPLGVNKADEGHCAVCSAGTYKPTMGSSWRSKCSSCSPGRHSAASATSCSHCAKGRYQPSRGAATCVACPEGRYAEAQGRTALSACVSCPSGKFAGAKGAEKCTQCTAGKFGHAAKATTHGSHCVACPEGKFQKYDGSAECLACPSGQFQHKPEQLHCHLCSVPMPPYTYAATEVQGKARVYWTANAAGAQSCQPKPVDCELHAWTGAWGACDRTCGHGTKIERRTVKVDAWPSTGPYTGAACNDADMTRSTSCFVKPCPIHCTMSAWGKWGGCSLTCGGGVQMRKRKQVIAPLHGGTPCGADEETKSCETSECPVDCKLNAWKDWGSCSVSCGGGRRTRTRTRKVEPKFGGVGCAPESESEACNPQCCPGKHPSGPGTCTACPAGTFSLTGGSCDACAPGEFQPSTGQTTCQQCPSGQHQPDSGRTALTHCKDCPKGKYQAQAGSGSCVACGAGRFNAHASRSDAADCHACSPGSHAPTSGAGECVQCAPGQYQDGSGKDQCKECDAGKYTGPHYASTSELDCNFCKCGHWSVRGASVCSECAVGRFRSCAGGKTQCDGGWSGDSCAESGLGHFAVAAACAASPCPAGSYSDNSLTGVCKQCPAGHYAAASGATSIAVCKPCSTGHYSSAGAAQCSTCDAGKFAAATASPQCDACAAGKRSTKGSASTSCTDCEAGRWSNSKGAAACTLCAVGRFADAAKATGNVHDMCRDCQAGRVQPLAGKTTCDACAEGHYQAMAGSTTCDACEPGTAHASRGATAASDCKPCSTGHYQSASGSNACIACDVGRVNPNKGSFRSDDCVHCADGQFAEKQGMAQCELCSKGRFNHLSVLVNNIHHHCLKCPSGQYQEADGMTACVDCESGRYTHAGEHDMIQCVHCSKSDVDGVRKYDTKGLAGQSQCWPVPVDCLEGSWGSWGTCSKSCTSLGGTPGVHTRTRSPARQPAEGKCGLENTDSCTAAWGGGRKCSDPVYQWSQTRQCNVHVPCPIDCIVSDWSSWEMCTKTCGGGTTYRVRTITTHPEHGGVQCPVLREDQACNAHACGWGHLPTCHSAHVRCSVQAISHHNSALKRPELPGCAHSGVEESNSCWNNHNCKAASQNCHNPDSNAERALRDRLGSKPYDTIVVKHDRKNMVQNGNFHCTCVIDPITRKCKRSHEANNCQCKCNRHPPCCAQKNKLLPDIQALGAGSKYTSVANVQECCNLCNNHPGCSAWEFEASLNVCVLKKGKVFASSYVAVPAAAVAQGTLTYSGERQDFGPVCNRQRHSSVVEEVQQKIFESRAAWRADGTVARNTEAWRTAQAAAP